MDNVLVLVRHGESEWNKLNLFTGWKDPDLSAKGVVEAHVAGDPLPDWQRAFLPTRYEDAGYLAGLAALESGQL